MFYRDIAELRRNIAAFFCPNAISQRIFTGFQKK